MSYLDGRQAVAYLDRLNDTCTADDCDARGVTVFGGSLRCIGHAVPITLQFSR